MQGPTAKKLLLDLLLAVDPQPVAARNAVGACALFGIGESNARVTLTRLAANGMIESAERGSYRLSPSAHEVATEIAGWRRLDARLRPWSGEYVCVHTAALGRSDRVALRRRRRALDMLGFRKLSRGLHLRPDNVETDTEAVRRRLRTLGLDGSAQIFLARDFADGDLDRIDGLWDRDALNAGYRDTHARLTDWLEHRQHLELETAARESFLLGGDAIRRLVFDPLLPEPMVDTEARRQLLATTRHFDQVGQAIWQQLFDRGFDTAQTAAA